MLKYSAVISHKIPVLLHRFVIQLTTFYQRGEEQLQTNALRFGYSIFGLYPIYW